MKKVNESESQQAKKARANEGNNMTAEQLAAEQEKIFEQARNFELKHTTSFQPSQIAMTPQENQLTALEKMRDELMEIDFEVNVPDDSNICFNFDD